MSESYPVFKSRDACLCASSVFKWELLCCVADLQTWCVSAVFLEAVLLLSAAAVALNCVSVIRELICELPLLWMLVVSGYLLLWLPFPCVAGNRTWSTAEWDSAPTPTHVHQDGWGLGHSVTEPPSVTQRDAFNSEFRVCTPQALKTVIWFFGIGMEMEMRMKKICCKIHNQFSCLFVFSI